MRSDPVGAILTRLSSCQAVLSGSIGHNFRVTLRYQEVAFTISWAFDVLCQCDLKRRVG